MPLDHADSNYRLLKEHILDFSDSVVSSQVILLDISKLKEQGSVEEAAEVYEKEMIEALGVDGKVEIDLILLGISFLSINFNC